MKKLTKFILLIVLTCIPVNIFACPHVDSEGNQHLQTYNSDYTIMNMIYPMEGYLYTKIVTMYLDGVYVVPNEDTVLSEGFGFAIAQDLTTYMGYYWFMDESYVTNDYEDLDIEVTVENTENQYVSGTGYSLNVYFENTYTAGVSLENEYTNQVYYEVLVDQLTVDERSSDQSLFISENDLALANEEIFYVTADFLHVEINSYLYTSTYFNIYDFYDDVEVCLESDVLLNNPVAINLDNFTSEEDFIKTTYNEEEGCYDFTINEVGSYIVVESFDVVYTNSSTEKLENDIVLDENNEVKEDYEEDKESVDDNEVLLLDSVTKDSEYTAYVIGGIGALLLVFAGIAFVALKKRK